MTPPFLSIAAMTGSDAHCTSMFTLALKIFAPCQTDDSALTAGPIQLCVLCFLLCFSSEVWMRSCGTDPLMTDEYEALVE